MTVTRLSDQKLFIGASPVVVRAGQCESVTSAWRMQSATSARRESRSAARRCSSRLTDDCHRAQTLANGFWNSISWAARTSSAMPRSRSMVVSKPFLRIFS